MRKGLKLKLLYNYMCEKVGFASLDTLQKYHAGQIVPKEVWSTVLKNVFSGQMLYFCRSKGSEMEPSISAEDTLVVRKLPYLNARLTHELQRIHVGDVVVLKDPAESDNHVIRRVAAVEGHEMLSTNEEDEPFVIEHGQCWVLSDNKILKLRECYDSRTFGPISMTDIVGRVIYRYRSLQDNGFVINSRLSMNSDVPVLYAELDSVQLQSFAESDEKTKDS